MPYGLKSNVNYFADDTSILALSRIKMTVPQILPMTSH